MPIISMFDYAHFTENEHNQTLKSKFITLRDTFFFCIFGLIISVIVVSIFDGIYRSIAGHDLIRPILKHKISSDIKSNFSPWIVVFLAPIFEEFEGRFFLSLTKFSISVSLFCIFFFYSGPVWYLQGFNFEVLMRLLLALILAIITHQYLPENILTILKNNFKYVFVFSALLFGFEHITNFSPLTPKVILLSPLLVLTQIFYGFGLGYIRMKNGLMWSILLHITINSVAFLI